MGTVYEYGRDNQIKRAGISKKIAARDLQVSRKGGFCSHDLLTSDTNIMFTHETTASIFDQ